MAETFRTALIAAVALPVALGGCISFGPKPPASLLTIAPTQTVQPGTTRQATDRTAVAVAVPAVPQALMTQRVAVASNASNYAYLKDALWVEAPNRLFRSVLAETIQARTGRVVPDLRSPALSPDTRLTGELSRFGLDAAANQVVVRYDASLVRSGVDQVSERRFEASVPVAAQDAQSVATALGQAANQVAGEVADWVGR